MMNNSTRYRTALAVTSVTALGLMAAVPAAAATDPASDSGAGGKLGNQWVVDMIDRNASPLPSNDDHHDQDGLRAFSRMVGGADVVGVGEATHASTEFAATKRQLFEHLVEEQGFRTFAQEISWSTGVRLNDYIQYGTGDPAAIMQREMQNTYRFFNNEEMLELVEWLREYNQTHAETLRFVGADVGFAGANVFDRVTDYVDSEHPELSEQIRELYSGLRPGDEVDAYTFMRSYQAKPMDERRAMLTQAERAYQLLDEVAADDEKHAEALQHARAIVQTAKLYSFDMEDPEGMKQQNLHRDQAMAANVVWWQHHTDDRVMLSAQNGHVGYVSDDAEFIPKPQGAFLREELGRDYVNVGFSFDHGEFHAFDQEEFFGPERPESERHGVEPAEPGSNEHMLDQVGYDDYVVDLRRLPSSAREWLQEERPTRNVGLFWPEEAQNSALGESYDVLIHLNEVEASTLL